MGRSRFSSHSEMPNLEGACLPDTFPLPAPFQPHQSGSLPRRQPTGRGACTGANRQT